MWIKYDRDITQFHLAKSDNNAVHNSLNFQNTKKYNV